MVRRCLSIAILLLFATLARDVIAWGNEGHEIVARIAAHHLTKTTRAAVARLLNNDTQIPTLPADPTPDALADAMAIAATWPDHINKTSTQTGDWHFIDIGLLETQSVIPGRCGSARDCVALKILDLEANLKSNTPIHSTPTTVFEPFEELKFLIHFVGDIHQPLHAATNQDAGGNCLVTSGFGQTELHAVWDTGLVNEIRKAPAQRTGKSASPHSLASTTAVAAALDKSITTADLTAWSKTIDPVAMAMDSHQLAVSASYAPLKPPVAKMPGFVPNIHPGTCTGVPADFRTNTRDVDKAYGAATLNVVRTQLSKGGIRLAQILNNTFDPGH